VRIVRIRVGIWYISINGKRARAEIRGIIGLRELRMRVWLRWPRNRKRSWLDDVRDVGGERKHTGSLRVSREMY
jgi:hypothetical protein